MDAPLSGPSLDGRVALITGVTSGIGRVIAAVFAQRGARVVGTGRRTELGNELEAEVRTRGLELSFLSADVRRVEDCRAIVDHAIETYGRLDILVNNAGIEGPIGNFHDVGEDEWDDVVDVNLKGTAFCCRYAIPHMISAGKGVILNVASINAVEAIAHMAPYNASKAAVVQLTRSLAVEYLAQGIRVNAIVLGGVEGETGDRTRAALQDLLGADAAAESGARRPAQQDPIAVADAFALLCTDEARAITGATIAIDRAITAGATTSALIHLKLSAS